MPAQIGGKTYSNGELILGVGLVVALINWFIPWWWAYSFNYSGIAGSGGLSSSGGTGGFGDIWGILGFIVLLALIALFVIRPFAPQVLPALPAADYLIYAVGGVFILLMVVLFLTYAGTASVSGIGYSAGISIGFFIGLVAAAAIAVGGWLKKTDVQPATAPMNFSGFNQAPPPPPPAAL
jgi:hypothetical protein